MIKTKNSKLQKKPNPYTRFFNGKRSQISTGRQHSSIGSPNRCASVYLIAKNVKKRVEMAGGKSSIRTTKKIIKSHVPKSSGGPSWKPARDVQDDQYMVITEDYTIPAMQYSPRLDAICYDELEDTHKQQLNLECSTVPVARGTRISICVENTRFPLVGRVSKNMGYQHVPQHRLWNIQWCDATPHMDLFKAMKRFQQINHFPGMCEIYRKDSLSRNLNRMLKMYPGDYRIFPKTWLLPSDAYEVAMYASRHKRTYILKPYSSGRGRGIWLTSDLSLVGKREKLICQTYIDKPLLIDGYKFDLRVYTLVTSVEPLRIFVYNEGLARFATHKYVPPTCGNSSNIYMHLTNYSLNRHNADYDAGSGDDGGSKRKLSAFNKWMTQHEYSVEEFWASVDDAIIKTIISAWPVLRHNYQICFPRHDKIQASFQLLGFDILVDWKLKPYILEVNHAPSLSGDEVVDNEVKRPLIRDTLSLLSTVLVDKDEIIREDRAVMRERLMQRVWSRRQVKPNHAQHLKDAANLDANGKAFSLDMLAQQVAWEESHLGNYRRIMPPTDSAKVNYYCKFYDQTKQILMFAGTASSRQREQLTRQQLQQQEILQRNRQLRLHNHVPVMQMNGNKSFDWVNKTLNRITPMMISGRAMAIDRVRRNNHKSALRRMQELQQLKRLPDHLALLDAKSLKRGVQHVGVWQTLTKPIKLPKTRYKGHGISRLKRHKRRVRRKQRLERRFESDIRKDAQFLAENALRQPAGARMRGGSVVSAISVPPKPKSRKQRKQRKSKLELRQPPPKPPKLPKPPKEPKECKIEASKSEKKLKSCLVKSNKSNLSNWLPTHMNESEELTHLEWRRKRTEALKKQHFKEHIFTHMYHKGHLSKNDIRKYPELLYRILKNDTSKSSQANSSHVELVDEYKFSHPSQLG